MSIGILTKCSVRYQVQTPIYEGPLDLLLQLIEKAELDITKLSLAQVTEQFLAHLHTLQNLETNEISYFIIVATKLLYIKSQMLLPKVQIDSDMEEEEDGEDLIRQLKEYKKFRQIAEVLGERENMGLRTYLRLASPPKIEAAIDLSDLDLKTFLIAAQSVFQNTTLSAELHGTIIKPKYSIKEQIYKIVQILKENGRTTFLTLIQPFRSRSEVITVFLALLELIKQHQIEIQQAQLFDDIEIFPSSDLFETGTLESEFED